MQNSDQYPSLSDVLTLALENKQKAVPINAALDKLVLYPPKPRKRIAPLKLKPAISHLFWAWNLKPDSWHLLSIRDNSMNSTKLAVWTGRMFMSHITGPVNGNTIVGIRKSF